MVSIANDKPGYGSVTQNFDVSVSVSNTTPGRNYPASTDFDHGLTLFAVAPKDSLVCGSRNGNYGPTVAFKALGTNCILRIANFKVPDLAANETQTLEQDQNDVESGPNPQLLFPHISESSLPTLKATLDHGLPVFLFATSYGSGHVVTTCAWNIGNGNDEIGSVLDSPGQPGVTCP